MKRKTPEIIAFPVIKIRKHEKWRNGECQRLSLFRVFFRPLLFLLLLLILHLVVVVVVVLLLLLLLLPPFLFADRVSAGLCLLAGAAVGIVLFQGAVRATEPLMAFLNGKLHVSTENDISNGPRGASVYPSVRPSDYSARISLQI